ncbi:MAG: Hsp20/alpha crystallin family protein [Desulfobacteraceae bacterium]
MLDILPWKKKENSPRTYKSKQDRFFDNMLTDWFGTPDRFRSPGMLFDEDIFPKIDISEGIKHIRVKAEIPGVDADDMDVSLDGRRLTIKGEKKHEHKESNENRHWVEQSYGFFNRSIDLPADVDPEKVETKFKNGILKLKLKKTKESRPSRIEVKSG